MNQRHGVTIARIGSRCEAVSYGLAIVLAMAVGSDAGTGHACRSQAVATGDGAPENAEARERFEDAVRPVHPLGSLFARWARASG